MPAQACAANAVWHSNSSKAVIHATDARVVRLSLTRCILMGRQPQGNLHRDLHRSAMSCSTVSCIRVAAGSDEWYASCLPTRLRSPDWASR